MSCYNGSAYLNEQIRSIFDQTAAIAHLSIWDDCSKDDTLAQLLNLAAGNPAIAVQGGERNMGVNQGFQAALQRCPESAWYAFSDQDDVWPRDRIERFLTHAHARSHGHETAQPLLLVCQFAAFEKTLPTPGQPTSLQLLRHGDASIPWAHSLLAANPMYGCCFFFNEALRALVGNIPPGKTTHDYWIALLAAYFGRIEVLDFVGTYYRQHGANASYGAPRAGWLNKLGTVRRSMAADRRSRLDMLPLIEGLLTHPRQAELKPQDRALLQAALAAYQRGGLALLAFQRRQGVWARRGSQNALRALSCLTDKVSVLA